MAERHDERGMVVNSASDPQRPGEPVGGPKPDTSAPGTSAQETSVPTPPLDPAAARDSVERPAPGTAPGGDVERS